VGDIIVDHYVRGISERISPEAPVPVVLFESEESIPGGAANVARNIASMGAHASCIGVSGTDADGDQLIKLLKNLSIETGSLVRDANRATTVKTRVMALNQQMIRLDRETNAPVSPETEARLIEQIRDAMAGCHAVVLSDYAKGVLTPDVIAATLDQARRMHIPVLVDPKGRAYGRYRGAYALTPNAREAADATGIPTNTHDGLAAAAAEIMRQTECQLLVITRGADGIALFEPGAAPLFMPTEALEVFDVTGAGDTFVGLLATAIGAGIDHHKAAALANTAAGVVVGKSGAAVISPDELRAALEERASKAKIVRPEELGELGEKLRAGGKRIVLANGCFDFIHAGHIDFLQRARALGDVLVLATNSDAAITRLKGAPRPVIRRDQRLRLLAAINEVDYLTVFEDDTPHEIIRALQPDVLVKGKNYTTPEVEGHEIISAQGGNVVLLDLIHELSTGDILKRDK
jgi:D-beta-D-heptose 7-phosphate kinase/D-beta-D-heptose 1-phosphate adenosyltransferase